MPPASKLQPELTGVVSVVDPQRITSSKSPCTGPGPDRLETFRVIDPGLSEMLPVS